MDNTKNLPGTNSLAYFVIAWAGNTKGGSITVPLTSCLTGFADNNKNCQSANSKPVKQEVNNTAGNTKGGSITVPLTSCLTGLD